MKPILFNTDMVRAILDSHKTVTRRVVKPQPEGAHSILDCDEEKRTFDLLCGNGGVGGVFVDWAETVKAPFWPHDILYVRETWAPFYETMYSDPVIGYRYYSETDEEIKERIPEYLNWFWPGRWSPSIHMPRKAARIFLRVTDVRVERLQDMPPYDIAFEGFRKQKDFIELWNNTLKPADRALYGWDANPWVWVIEFERITREEVTPHA